VSHQRHYCGKNWPEERIEELVRLYASGKTFAEIAAVMHTSPGIPRGVYYQNPVARAIRKRLHVGERPLRKKIWSTALLSVALVRHYEDNVSVEQLIKELAIPTGRRQVFAAFHSKRGQNLCKELGIDGLKQRRLQLAGQRFGKLRVIRRAACLPERPGRSRWLCRCSCRNTHIVDGMNLTRGIIKSCGCAWHVSGKKNSRYKNGRYTKRNFYTNRSFYAMHRRCECAEDIGYENYGGRGISVCARWSGPDGFENFLADMGRRPKGKSLDRIDPFKNYEPSNCRWATSKQQNNNRRMHHEPPTPEQVVALAANAAVEAQMNEVVF
jgi:hypothetical protein